MPANERTRVAIAGGGPAGMFLGLILARGGVSVTVLEKHADFLRDFRGDTVHPSTLTLLDELGLGEQFASLPQRRITWIGAELDSGPAQLGDLTRLRVPHRYIALVPQWDLLELLADAGAREPGFRLLREAEVTGLLRDGGTGDGGRVTGVVWRGRADGGGPRTQHTLEADLVVACDGRGSSVRAAAGLVPREFGAPMDVWWFRVRREQSDPEGAIGRLSRGQFLIMIDRGDYWQCGFLIRKGADAKLRDEGLDAFRSRLAALQPWLADRLGDAPASFDDVKLLDVRLDRLDRWHLPGLLVIGDAAHAMSPVGGVGINLAVQDAVAAARILQPALARGGPPPESVLQSVQRRRWWPTVVVQSFQQLAHYGVVNRFLDEDASERPRTPESPRTPASPRPPEGMGRPLPFRIADALPALRGIPARLVGIGPLPEHAPYWARR
ncbi:FAD-dependent oxidoreductase [Sinomonas sp. JGH33]|uniref:FAD-dependent oxidoreductase n=1 Tax=Sinomonas terricola TaxID=3110330 RepID=A0ABU5T9Y7_9MICC|nr:FAD-dependent oxidoreductase [Sinomonas sp. JGH33]MEA5456342.1 FAD-dependent oxidoreductase [Sinomonas sp. JGH33]